MEPELHRANFQKLLELSRSSQHKELALVATKCIGAPSLNGLEQGVTRILWAYAHLRLDPHRYHQQAIAEAAKGAALLPGERATDPPLVDWALLTYGMCLQLVGDHPEALRVCDELLAKQDLSLPNRIKAWNSRAYSLYHLGRRAEAAHSFHEAAQYLDALPADQLDPQVRCERQRLRVNLADHYLSEGEPARAEAELNAVDLNYITPLIATAITAHRARAALMLNRWNEAAEYANQALGVSIEGQYKPLRVDALTVLTTLAGLQGRRDDLIRLALEIAALERGGD